MNEVIGFDARIEKLMPLQVQGILLSKLRGPLSIVLVLGFFRRQPTEDDDDHEHDQEIPAC
jgi:hypothetical protein